VKRIPGSNPGGCSSTAQQQEGQAMTREKAIVLAIWIGLCLIPEVGPSLSDLYVVWRFFRSVVIDEE
jgi:hypothetical protein